MVKWDEAIKRLSRPHVPRTMMAMGLSWHYQLPTWRVCFINMAVIDQCQREHTVPCYNILGTCWLLSIISWHVPPFQINMALFPPAVSTSPNLLNHRVVNIWSVLSTIPIPLLLWNLHRYHDTDLINTVKLSNVKVWQLNGCDHDYVDWYYSSLPPEVKHESCISPCSLQLKPYFGSKGLRAVVQQ